MAAALLAAAPQAVPAWAAKKAELAAERSGRHFLEQVSGRKKPAKGKPAFTTRGCPKPSGAEWARVLLMDQPVSLKLRFAKDCDLEGDVILRKAGFPVDLKLRNVEGTDRARGRIASEVVADFMKGQMDVTLRVAQAMLSREGAGDYLKFAGDYNVLLGAEIGSSQPITLKENRGGKVRISEYLSKPAQAEVPFKIK
jgi:hypothetical protein